MAACRVEKFIDQIHYLMKELIDAINYLEFSIGPAVLVPHYHVPQLQCCFLRSSFCFLIENMTECLGWSLQFNQLLKERNKLFVLQYKKFTALIFFRPGRVYKPFKGGN